MLKLHIIEFEIRAVYANFENSDYPSDGDSTHLRNVGLLQRGYTALYPRRLSSSLWPSWGLEISQWLLRFPPSSCLLMNLQCSVVNINELDIHKFSMTTRRHWNALCTKQSPAVWARNRGRDWNELFLVLKLISALKDTVDSSSTYRITSFF
jgi:hypothetical protein